jgi:HAD superfamily phosphatase (TIGR01668 family)
MDFDQFSKETLSGFNNLKAKTLKALTPRQKANRIYDIDLNQLKENGIRALILDLDDTLLPKTSSDITPKLYNFIITLKNMGFKVCISSNNRYPKRVEFIAKTLELPYISLAFKPLPYPFEKALRILGTKKEETAIIGDQLFTDILGGNWFGIYTILVTPLGGETSWIRQLMRQAEQFFLNLK